MGPSFDDYREALAYIRADLVQELPPSISTAVAEQFVIRCAIDGAIDDWPDRSLDTGRAVVGAPFLGSWTVPEKELADLRNSSQVFLPLTAPKLTATHWPHYSFPRAACSGVEASP